MQGSLGGKSCQLLRRQRGIIAYGAVPFGVVKSEKCLPSHLQAIDERHRDRLLGGRRPGMKSW